MKIITRWKPDTCDCELYYEWDDTESENDRVHIPVVAETIACAIHKLLKDNVSSLHTAVKAENTSKNETMNLIAATFPELMETKLTPDGEVKVFIKETEPKWSFDADRKLVIENLDAGKQTILSLAVTDPKVILK